MGVEIRQIIFELSAVARKLSTAWSPSVISVSTPVAASKRPRLVRPSRPKSWRALAVRAPDGWVLAAGSGRRLIAERALSDIAVELRSEVPWFRVLRYVEHPQVRLGIGIYRLVLRSDKGELFAVGAKREAIRAHINCR